MAPLLLGYRDEKVLLLTFAGPRPLLLDCPPELRVQPSLEPLLPEARPLRGKPRSDWGDVPPPEVPRRTPEIPADPRTAFRHRRPTTPQVGPRTRADQPTEAKAADAHVSDLLIVPKMAAFRVSDQGIKALVTYLRTAQILVAKVQKPFAEGIALELLPDTFSHLAFAEGAAPPGEPSILEGLLWFGTKPQPLPFGDAERKCCFRLELLGNRYPKPNEAFLARLNQILHLRPEVIAVPHDPARLRSATHRVATEPIPRVDMQEV